MSKKRIDLDKLAAELTAAGVPFGDNTFLGGARRLQCFGWTIWTGGDEDTVGYQGTNVHPMIWPAIDIIRRYVDPMSAQQDQLPFAPTVPDLHTKLLSIFDQHTYELSANDVTFSEFNPHGAANAILQLLGLPEVEPPERAVPPAEDGEMPW